MRPSLGGFLGRFSWHLPFAAYLIGIPIGILAMIAVPEIRRGKTLDHQDHNKKTSATKNQKKPDSENQKMSVVQIFKRVPILFLIYGLIFFANILLYVIVVFLPQHLEKIDISNPFHIGMLISTAPLFGEFIGQFSSPLIFGPVALSFGLNHVFLTAGGASALFFLGVLVFMRQ